MATRSQPLRVTVRDLEDQYQAGYATGHAAAMRFRELYPLYLLITGLAAFGAGLVIGALY